MGYLKKFCNPKANSILESVVALCIISVCLYMGVLIFAAVFTPRTSARFYNTQNKVNELFFLTQLKNDSLLDENRDTNLMIDEEEINSNLKKVTVHYKDSSKFQFEKSFYVRNTRE